MRYAILLLGLLAGCGGGDGALSDNGDSGGYIFVVDRDEIEPNDTSPDDLGVVLGSGDAARVYGSVGEDELDRFTVSSAEEGNFVVWLYLEYRALVTLSGISSVETAENVSLYDVFTSIGLFATAGEIIEIRIDAPGAVRYTMEIYGPLSPPE